MNTAYYARCQAIYGTPQEARDIELIESLGYRVLEFPSQDAIDAMKLANHNNPDWNVMDHVFMPIVRGANILFFRSLPGLAIPAGVAREIKYATNIDTPVLELPSFSMRPILDVDDTRLYLKEIGQR